ncbi:MAG: PAS domain-containing protein [Aquabacterium sp.]|uniref:sensor histidine kinase n=1 Tax=Aquabacterium sp. TaxID=1872578 RepID=UPI0025BC7560|nr:ATP-binding protein [Aquabacterium sp.]MBI3382660.1 PAS domain-containing protein [Aquabacterium sp.]
MSSSRDSHASWFGEPPAAGTTVWADPGSTEAAFADSTQLNPHPPATGKPGATAADTTASDANRPSFHRIYRAFLTARFALAVVLLGLVVGYWALGNRPPLWMLMSTLGYAIVTSALLIWPNHARATRPDLQSLRPREALVSVGIDLGFFAAMHYLSGSTLNSQALLVLPVLMAAVLMPRVLALGVAAAATLNLLGAALLQGQDSGNLTSLLAQAGLTGFGLFAIAALASELSARLAKEERSARGSLELARQQAQLNRLVIEEMSEGVMVVDRQGRVRTANPAARRLLAAQGLLPPAPFQLRGVPSWQGLIAAVEKALGNPQRAEDGQEVKLQFDDQTQRELRLRVRFTKGKGGRTTEDMCVMLLEDLRAVRARQRQDKLAAMGRMSAGIAHEIRNPLAAISQANALLAEDAATPTQKKLTQLVTDNVARLKHIIDDILAVAPGVRPPAPAIDPIETIVAICNDWRSTQGLAMGEDSLLDIDTSGCQRAPTYPHLKIRFEPEHLQRVLVNLLDNALRYNTGEPGAISVCLRWMPSADPAGLLMLSVSNDGEPVSADTERSLFEPFFSTRSRGTGLGLYICRELCERHGANIDYRLHPPPVRHRNEFFVTVPVEPNGQIHQTA